MATMTPLMKQSSTSSARRLSPVKMAAASRITRATRYAHSRVGRRRMPGRSLVNSVMMSTAITAPP